MAGGLREPTEHCDELVAPMDVAAWLGLGLERYEGAFRDNDVDAAVLPQLTADDLINIGVISVGHRRKLLAAIAALGAKAQAVTVTAPVRTDAERRQLTVLLCDLAGSTALSARLDPEDLLELVAAYHRAVAKVVAGFDGFVAKYMGDGVPLSIEELTESVLESGLLRAELDRYVLDFALPPFAIPATLHDLASARMVGFAACNSPTRWPPIVQFRGENGCPIAGYFGG